ncbi:MAG: oxygen-dependent coproporphyrinogen oxidase [Saprospiraceae bacterium]|nr:oxygen-dependent coproporphyrinogen oxidase [Saprospiraceae bacterium]
MITRVEIEQWFQNLQDKICKGLEQADGKGKFQEDKWEHHAGGGGRSRVIRNGEVLEKGGVNFSAVSGKMPELLLKTLKVEADTKEELRFHATGVSIVLHPKSPMTPIIHMNVRYFEMTNGTWWFGGGIDLTPHYVSKDLARDFHRRMKAVCDAHHPSYYSEFKPWADEYFYIRHRQETRGIGGIFFDRLSNNDDFDKAARWAFVQDVGNAFVPTYTYQIEQTRNLSYGEEQVHWQRLRRGRYAEFNLVWDRGTKFGLQTNGRTESILMSLPPQANWVYNYQTEEKSPEANTLDLLKKGINWIEE